MDLVRVTAGDNDNKYMRAALVLRTLGWISIIWGLGISIWIYMGEKAGSQLWLWWTLGQFAFGFVCLAIAGHLQKQAAHLARSSQVETKDRAA